MKVCSAILLALLSVLVFANGLGAKDKERALQVSEFGKTKDGAAIQRYVLSNKKNFEVVVTNYGASLVSVKAPDRSGKIADVVFGYN
ncbi:MAG: galactose-1-epimerase, partial [Candidatus Acidiferrales bacterium]